MATEILPGTLIALEESEERLSLRFRQCRGVQLFAELLASFGCAFFASVFLIETSSRFDDFWLIIPVALFAGTVYAFGWVLWGRGLDVRVAIEPQHFQVTRYCFGIRLWTRRGLTQDLRGFTNGVAFVARFSTSDIEKLLLDAGHQAFNLGKTSSDDALDSLNEALSTFLSDWRPTGTDTL